LKNRISKFDFMSNSSIFNIISVFIVNFLFLGQVVRSYTVFRWYFNFSHWKGGCWLINIDSGHVQNLVIFRWKNT